MIPRIIHRVVPPRIDPEAATFWEGFQRLHPGWAMVTWCDDGRVIDIRVAGPASAPVGNLPEAPEPAELEVAPLLGRCRHGAQRADILRLEALWRFGGIYVDSDCEPVKAMDDLLGYSLFIGTEDAWHLSTGVIGAEPAHPAVRAYLDAVRDEHRLSLDVPPNESTGPHLATAVLAGRDDVVVLPPEFFYPYGAWQERPLSISEAATPYTFCAHHWAGSWVRAEPPRVEGGVVARTLEGITRRAARWAIANLRLASERVRPPIPNRQHGAYAGDNRMLVSLPDNLNLQAIADDLSLTPELVRNGIYDLPFWRFLGKVIKPGDHVVDVGANIGLFSIRMAQLVARFGRVHAIEADPELADLVRENAQMNWYADRVAVHQMAASERPGELTFGRHPRLRGNSRTVVEDTHSPAEGTHFAVEGVPLDSLFDRSIPIRLLKIDVEGGEWRVLRGARELLASGCVQYVDVEVVRSNAATEWIELIAELQHLVHDLQAFVFQIDHTGSLIPSVLDNIIATAGNFSHVVFELPPKRQGLDGVNIAPVARIAEVGSIPAHQVAEP